MGTTQSKQVHASKTVTCLVNIVKNEYYEEDKLQTILEQMNMKQQFPECLKTEYLHDVESLLAKFPVHDIRSEFQLLSSLSARLCRQLSRMKISCWVKSAEELRANRQSKYSSKLDVDNIAFGTLESVISFMRSSTPSSTTACATTYELEFQFKNQKICLFQKAGEQLFRLEIQIRHMHRIVHVVRRENRFDVYFQLQQPPLMYECVNPDDPEDKRRFRRRSYLHGITSEEIGPSDVLRVSFKASIDDETLQEVFSSPTEAENTGWELRFAWITERPANVAASDETGFSSFAVLYASKVLQSVGLRCQLINCLELLEGLPGNAHADELLYYVAKRYENEPQYYLIDIKKIIEQWKSTLNPNSNASSGDSTKVRTVILTPTRIIFRRPSTCESNRVFRRYFPGDRAEYVMKVYFRDEDVSLLSKPNLHFISLRLWNGALDDQVPITYICVVMG